ncbi:hypothetical protein HETIRDRAFT_99509, partial [Heterobasidion irregulare TC 32-1]
GGGRPARARSITDDPWDATSDRDDDDDDDDGDGDNDDDGDKGRGGRTWPDPRRGPRHDVPHPDPI